MYISTIRIDAVNGSGPIPMLDGIGHQSGISCDMGHAVPVAH